MSGKTRRTALNTHGFTIIEMMFATLAFSVILLILTASVIQIGKMFYKGVISSRTQDSARTVIDTVSRPIQFSAETISLAAPTAPNASQPAIGAVCIGTQRYTYALNAQVDDGVAAGSYSGGAAGNHKMRHALWVDTYAGASCAPLTFAQMAQATPSAGGKELVGANARLTRFDVSPGGGLGLWKVTIGVMYGDDDLIEFSDAGKNTPRRCLSGVSGSQWCALSELSTQVNQRLRR